MRGLVRALLFSLACSCAELGPADEPQTAAECVPAVRYPIPSGEEAERATIPLQACQRFETFLRLKSVLKDEHAEGEAPEPEWKQHGFYVTVAKSEVLSISWAEGYSDWDETVDSPEQRAWWSCNIPAELSHDIADIKFSARPYWDLGLASITLIDDAPLLQRKFEVAVDLERRVAFRRSLASLSKAGDTDCVAERECGLDARTGTLEAGSWMTPVSPSCVTLLEEHTTPSDRAVGNWPLRVEKDPDWF